MSDDETQLEKFSRVTMEEALTLYESHTSSAAELLEQLGGIVEYFEKKIEGVN